MKRLIGFFTILFAVTFAPASFASHQEMMMKKQSSMMSKKTTKKNITVRKNQKQNKYRMFSKSNKSKKLIRKSAIR